VGGGRAVAVSGEGHQRLRNEAKIRAIGRFLTLDPRNTIPTAITVALRGLTITGDLQLDACSSVEVPDSDPPAGLVIDGQHRLFGMSAFDPSLRVNVVALINPSDEEIAFQFLVINNKASKVATASWRDHQSCSRRDCCGHQRRRARA